MHLRLKKDINPEILKKYGFKTGKEWKEEGERCFLGDDFDQPIILISFRIGEPYGNDLYIECTSPSDTYSISGSDFDLVSKTIFKLTSDGLLEYS